MPKIKKSKPQNPQNNSYLKTPALDYDKAYSEAKALISTIDKKIQKSIPKGMQYDWLNNTAFNNLVYAKDKIPDRLLRLIERRNGIVGAIITKFIQQLMEFSQISRNKDVPGWEFVLADEDETMTPAREKQREFLENFFLRMKVQNYSGIEKHFTNMRDMLTKYARDRILIDKICIEIERDRKGQMVALWPLDGATILPVLPGGFYGSTSQIGVGISTQYNRLSDEIRKAKLDNIPPVEEISYVQELIYGSSGGGIVAAFRETDLVYDISNELNDIRYYKQGFSVTEKANVAVVAFINSLTFNSNGLSRGSIPKIAISMGKESGYTQEQLEDAQDEWMANFSAMDGQWNIPLLNGDAKVLNLLPNNRDMEYQKYMEFVGAMTCSIMGVDAAEIGLRLNQASAVLSENQDAKQIFSKARGLKDMLSGWYVITQKIMDISGLPYANDWKFRFNGLETEDKSFEADLRKKAIETEKTINEVRAEQDLPPDKYGDIICNPQYIQYRIQKEQMESMGGQPGDEGGEPPQDDEENDDINDDDINEITDTAIGEMQKAVRLI